MRGCKYFFLLLAMLAVSVSCGSTNPELGESTSSFTSVESAFADLGESSSELASVEEITVNQEEAPPSDTGSDTGTSEDGFNLGLIKQVGDWKVKIVSITPSKDVALYSTESEETLVGYLLEIEGTYEGEDEGHLNFLTVSYEGRDKVVYKDYDSYASYEAAPDQDPKSVVQGGSARWTATLAFPPEAGGNSTLKVESLGGFNSAEFEVGDL